MPAPKVQQQHHHRSSVRPQKSFKSGKHSSKSSLKEASKGRQTSKPHKSTRTSAQRSHSKADRRNTAKQLQANKRANTLELVRGKESRAPRSIALVNLCEDGRPEEWLRNIGAQLEENGQIWHLDVTDPRPASLRIMIANENDSRVSLIADSLIFYISGTVQVSPQEENHLRSLIALATPPESVRLVIHSLPDSASAAAASRKSLMSYITRFIPDVKRSFDADNVAPLLRTLVDGKLKDVSWRKGRARLLAESYSAASLPSTSSEENQESVDITGYIKGGFMSANRLIHIPGAGDFQLEKIIAAPLESKKNINKEDSMDVIAEDNNSSNNILSSRDEARGDTLQAFNDPDPGADLGEQTWPTEEEVMQGEQRQMEIEMQRAREEEEDGKQSTTTVKTKRIPKGFSEYQAAWIPSDEELSEFNSSDDDEEDEEDEEDEDMSDEGEEEVDENDEKKFGDDEMAGVDTATNTGGVHFDLPEDKEKEEYREYQRQKQREREEENQNDMDFPDEIDTPVDVPARTRFARFRGLKSFRTSRWDPYENLPMDYSKCFMFSDWRGMGRKEEKRALSDGVSPGERVTLRVKGLSKDTLDRLAADGPVIAYNIYKHEHKYSVVNFTIQRNTECEDAIRSKDPLILQVGPRTYKVNPIFSVHTAAKNGKGQNNVHKFERYLRHGVTSVATMYMPICFGRNLPAVFRKLDGTLVAMGSLLSVDPTRVIAKRYILSGHPYKVHTKTATIRYMFFNNDDVQYFKPIQLHTKKGRIGYIKESLGMHGYFKAGFDGPIDQVDTICLSLYKRCFPKWAEEAVVPDKSASEEQMNDS